MPADSETISRTVQEAYARLLSVHGEFAASAGNCGMAARAVCTFLRLTNTMEDPRLAFLAEDTRDDNVRDPLDPGWIVEREALLYHVLLDAGEAGMFDDTGPVDDAGLLELSRREYRDAHPFLIRGALPESMGALQAIEWETNWSIPAARLCLTLLEGDPEIRITLFHGTTQENAEILLQDGFDPSRCITGANGGRAGHLYLTDRAENARWYAGEDGTVLAIRIRFSDLVVDPEDGVAPTVIQELMSSHGLPANLATTRPLAPDAITLGDPGSGGAPEP